MRIVIAEDEGTIRLDLAETLRGLGHEVIGEAKDGSQALAFITDLEPDAAILDIAMPHMTGLEVAEALAQQGTQCPLVILSAFSDQEYIARAANSGVYAYLVKPFTEDDIEPALHIAISRFLAQTVLKQEVQDLSEQLEARKVLDRAKGILMKQGYSEPEAFKLLQKTAMDKRRSLVDVAQAIVLSDSMLNS